FNPFVSAGIIIAETDNINKMYPRIMTHTGVSAVKRLIINMVTAKTDVAGIIKTRGPNLSNKCPIKGDIAPFKILPGNNTNPAVQADNANGPCMKTGKIISDANIAMMMIMNITTECVYIGYVNTRKFIIGSSSCY